MGIFSDAAQRESNGAPGRMRVVSAAIVREGHILLAQRSWDTSHPLAWRTPGGKVEPGESDIMALRRELHEELCVALSMGYEPAVVFDVCLDPPDVARSVRVTCYRVDQCDLIGTPRPADDTAGLGWFSAFDLCSFPGLRMAPSDRLSRNALIAAARNNPLGLVAVAAAYSERAHEPLVSVRASGDAGHEDGCARDHVTPGVCVSASEEVRRAC